MIDLGLLNDYAFSFFTEVSGNWTAPSHCEEALIIYAGGGGGGGAHPANSPAPAGAGGAGGNTTITGSFGTIVSLGGAGGATNQAGSSNDGMSRANYFSLNSDKMTLKRAGGKASGGISILTFIPVALVER